jgi:hypothetical protein
MTDEERGLQTHDPADEERSDYPRILRQWGREVPEKGPADLAREAGHSGEDRGARPRRGARPKERPANSDPIVQ